MGTTDSEVITKSSCWPSHCCWAPDTTRVWPSTKNRINPGERNKRDGKLRANSCRPCYKLRVLIGDSRATRNIEGFDCCRQPCGILGLGVVNFGSLTHGAGRLNLYVWWKKYGGDTVEYSMEYSSGGKMHFSILGSINTRILGGTISFHITRNQLLDS